MITEKIVQPDTYALQTFWSEFCEQYQCHAAIEEIFANQPITNQGHRLKLENYGYIVSEGEG